jgi:ribosomal protein L33
VYKTNKSLPLLTDCTISATIGTTMSQDLLVKLVSLGDAKGVGKGHVYYTRFNNKVKKDPSKKYETKKFNPIAQKHTVYKQKK